MKPCVVCACVLLLAVACSSDKSASDGGAGQVGSAGTAGAAVTVMGGAGGSVAGSAGSSGMTTTVGGSVAAGSGGTAAGSGGTAGSVASAGSAGSAGSGGAASTGFKCPAGPYAALTVPAGNAARVVGAPPSDGFNTGHGNVEGPVWIADALYFSEMKDGDIPLARILKLVPGSAATVAIMDTGTNGLAVDPNGILTGAVHKDGSISQFALPGGAVTPLVTKYNNTRFTSPNDLAIRSDGTIYFSDPKYQNSANPQGGERLYWVTPAPARTVTAVTGAPSTPNGVTLSPDEKTLYVSGTGLKKFTVNTDGSLSNPTDVPGGGGGDGMVMDCAGDLFVATGNNVQIFPVAGGGSKSLNIDGNGASITNVAFGNADHKTLYITAQGNDGQRGVFSIALNVPGYPY